MYPIRDGTGYYRPEVTLNPFLMDQRPRVHRVQRYHCSLVAPLQWTANGATGVPPHCMGTAAVVLSAVHKLNGKGGR